MYAPSLAWLPSFGCLSLAKPTRVAELISGSGTEYQHVSWTREGTLIASITHKTALADVRTNHPLLLLLLLLFLLFLLLFLLLLPLLLLS